MKTDRAIPLCKTKAEEAGGEGRALAQPQMPWL